MTRQDWIEVIKFIGRCIYTLVRIILVFMMAVMIGAARGLAKSKVK